MTEKQKESKQISKTREISVVNSNGAVVESIFDKHNLTTRYVISDKESVSESDSHVLPSGASVYPISPDDLLLKNNIVKLPSKVGSFENLNLLVSDIKRFIHSYVDLSSEFEIIATYYILLTWVYEQFNELPYLRKVGDFGTGKTRFLKVIGSICYKTVFVSGGTSTAALFHIIDKTNGSLVIDEADFNFSDEKAAVAKILNNGNAAGFPILRVSQDSNGKYSPVSYNVFCPKVVASRGNYDDQALESRFITEKVGYCPVRDDIPTTLPDSFEQDALALRNKLLAYRFKYLFKIKKYVIRPKFNLESRINQIFSPLLSVIDDADHRQIVLNVAVKYSQELQNERSQNTEAQVLSILKSLLSDSDYISVKLVTSEFSYQYADFHERKVTSKWIGYILRKKLGLSTYKSNGNYVVNTTGSAKKLNDLYIRYGVS